MNVIREALFFLVVVCCVFVGCEKSSRKDELDDFVASVAIRPGMSVREANSYVQDSNSTLFVAEKFPDGEPGRMRVFVAGIEPGYWIFAKSDGKSVTSVQVTFGTPEIAVGNPIDVGDR